MHIEEKILQLGLKLPAPPPQGGVYKSVLVVDRLAYFSGHGPHKSDGTLYTGRVGADVDLEFGNQAARQTGLAILANMKKHLGSLDKVKRVVKCLGLVNCTPDFHDHPAVIDGCSELFSQIFGEENGIGIRSAFGAASLPGNMTVEIEGIFEIK